MARTLSSGQVTNLASTVFQVEYLVTLLTGSGTNYYLTTGHSDIVVGGITYLSSNQLSVIGSIKESYDPNGNEVTIEFQTTDYTLIYNLNQKLLKTKITISKVYRDVTTNEPIFPNGIYTMYTGSVTAMTVQADERTQVIQLRSQSVFRNLDNVRNRKNTDIVPSDSRVIVWGTIVWQ